MRDHPYEIGGGLKKPGQIHERLLMGNLIPNLTVILRKSAVYEAGSFDEHISYAGDWDLWLRVAKIGKIHFIPETLACYRVEDDERPARHWASADGINETFAILNKNLDKYINISPDIVSLARAWVYVRAAIAAAQLNYPDFGYMYWLDALKESPSFFDNGDVQKMTITAVFIALLIENNQGYEFAVKFLHRLAAGLPVKKNKSNKIKRALIGQYFQQIVYLANKRKDFVVVRKYIFPALFRYPSWAADCDFWKIVFRAWIINEELVNALS